MQIRRGDIVIVDLEPTKGSEQQGGDRPCVVIQNDVGNQYSPTTIIAPFTTRYDPSDLYPFETEITAKETPLDEDSVADLSQIRVIDTANRVKKNVGSLSNPVMADIDRAIRNSLGL